MAIETIVKVEVPIDNDPGGNHHSIQNVLERDIIVRQGTWPGSLEFHVILLDMLTYIRNGDN